MPQYAVVFDPIVTDRLATLSGRDLDVVRDNITAIRENPRCFGSHPCGLTRARKLAWQHTCPHSWVVVFRWSGGDQAHPPGIVTVENIVERF